MWGIGTAAMMVAALLAPAPTGPDLPEPPPGPQQGCVLPLATVLDPVLDPCPPDDRDQPPGGCILPLQARPLAVSEPCPETDPDRSPRLDVFPLSR